MIDGIGVAEASEGTNDTDVGISVDVLFETEIGVKANGVFVGKLLSTQRLTIGCNTLMVAAIQTAVAPIIATMI